MCWHPLSFPLSLHFFLSSPRGGRTDAESALLQRSASLGVTDLVPQKETANARCGWETTEGY